MALAGSRSDAIALFRIWFCRRSTIRRTGRWEYQVCDRLIPAAGYRGQHSGRHHALEFREKLAKARLIEKLSIASISISLTKATWRTDRVELVFAAQQIALVGRIVRTISIDARQDWFAELDTAPPCDPCAGRRRTSFVAIRGTRANARQKRGTGQDPLL